MSVPKIENELSTGLVIAGAYADKLRRTLFAQLRDLVKKNKEFAREIARAAGEINRILYIILVENLKSGKGDVVRIRVKYTVDPKQMRITWHYDTLRVEYFKRHPDEQVMETVRKVIAEKLEEVKEQYREAPSREEAEKILREKTETQEKEWERKEEIAKAEAEKEKTVESIEKPTETEIVEARPMAAGVREAEREVLEVIKSADPIGETIDGGILFKLTDESGENIGVASLTPHAGGYLIDAIIISGGKAYRIYVKASKDKEEYMDKPGLLVEEIKFGKPVQISREEAQEAIQSKMESIV